jgi:acyl carrier protein
VHQHLAQALPAYMLPAAIVVLDALPLTANGKLDRRALPEPTIADDMHEAPASDTERRLETIWCNVLGRNRISVTADFFSLGGHSLLATRVAHAAQRELGIDVPLRLLFEKTTIRDIASVVDAHALRQRNLATATFSTEKVEMEW